MTSEKEIREWIGSKLEKFELNEEEYIDYIFSILEDNLTSLDERIEDCTQYLQSCVEMDFSDFATELKEKWDQFYQEQTNIKKQQQLELQSSREIQKEKEEQRLKQEAEELQIQIDREKQLKNESKLNKQEKKIRQEILSQYAFTDEVTEVDDQLVYKDAGTRDDSISDGLGFVNDNAERVKLKDQQQREDSKQKHVEKVRKDKENQEKEKLKKEKEKRRTQKREKRRL